MSEEAAVRGVLKRIEEAWRHRRFEGLDGCFHESATITGPGYAEFARGRAACAESYREFATNAAIVSYQESDPVLRLWESTAVYTFRWEMVYRRGETESREEGTDQLVLQRGGEGWQVVWRFIHFQPSE